MSRCFEAFIDDLSKKSGYSYDFIVDMYNEVMDDPDDGDIKSFVNITLEQDW